MEKTIQVKWEGKDVDVVVKEITWKEKTDCIRKAMKGQNGVRNKRVDPILQKEYMMAAAIKEAPFGPTVENIGKLNSRDGEKLFKTYSDLNDYDEEEGE